LREPLRDRVLREPLREVLREPLFIFLHAIPAARPTLPLPL
jgi:hypothetical protein